MNLQEEQQCIQDTLNGNMQAFTKLVDCYKDYVYTLIIRMVVDTQIAEELTQDTFIKVYKSLSSFSRLSKFSTWLYRIAYNTSLDYLKRNKVYCDDLDSIRDLSSENQNSLDQLLEKEKSQQIKEVINRLSKLDSVILKLYYFDEKSVKEISDIVGLKPNNVKQRLHRARIALREQLKKRKITY